MIKQFVRSFFIVLLLLSFIAPASANISAQQQTPSCPYEQVCQLAQQARNLLTKYNIPETELDNILRILGTSGVQGVAQYLGQLGLSQEEATAMLQEAAPLIEQGMSNAHVQAYIGQLVTQHVAENELLATRQQELFASLRNPETVMNILNELGITGQEAEEFLALQQFAAELGYSPATIERTAQANAIYQLLSEASDLSDEEKSHLTMLGLTDVVAFEAALAEKGVDVNYIYDNFYSAYSNFYAELGFSEEDLAKFQELAFAAEVIEAGGSIESMQNLLATYGFEQADIDALLDGWQGWSSPADVADFLANLGIGWQPEFDDSLDLYESDDYNVALEDWDSSGYVEDENTAGENTEGENTAGENTEGENTAGENTEGENTEGENTGG